MKVTYEIAESTKGRIEKIKDRMRAAGLRAMAYEKYIIAYLIDTADPKDIVAYFKSKRVTKRSH